MSRKETLQRVEQQLTNAERLLRENSIKDASDLLDSAHESLEALAVEVDEELSSAEIEDDKVSQLYDDVTTAAAELEDIQFETNAELDEEERGNLADAVASLKMNVSQIIGSF